MTDTDYAPVCLTVIWEPADMPDIRLIRAIEAIIDASVTGASQMTDEEVDAALAYCISRRAIGRQEQSK